MSMKISIETGKISNPMIKGETGENG